MKLRIIATAALAGLISQQAFAEGQGYVGATIGSTSTDDFSSDIDAALTSVGYTSSSTADDSDSGYKIFGGYLYNEFWGVEVGYMDLGEFGFSGTTTAPVASTFSGSAELDTWYLAGVLNLPVADTIAINARAGFAMWDASASVSASVNQVNTTVNGSGDDDGTDAILGVGVAFDVMNNIAIRVDYDRISADDDVDLISAGLHLKF